MQKIENVRALLARATTFGESGGDTDIYGEFQEYLQQVSEPEYLLVHELITEIRGLTDLPIDLRLYDDNGDGYTFLQVTINVPRLVRGDPQPVHPRLIALGERLQAQVEASGLTEKLGAAVDW